MFCMMIFWTRTLQFHESVLEGTISHIEICMVVLSNCHHWYFHLEGHCSIWLIVHFNLLSILNVHTLLQKVYYLQKSAGIKLGLLQHLPQNAVTAFFSKISVVLMYDLRDIVCIVSNLIISIVFLSFSYSLAVEIFGSSQYFFDFFSY